MAIYLVKESLMRQDYWAVGVEGQKPQPFLHRVEGYEGPAWHEFSLPPELLGSISDHRAKHKTGADLAKYSQNQNRVPSWRDCHVGF